FAGSWSGSSSDWSAVAPTRRDSAHTITSMADQPVSNLPEDPPGLEELVERFERAWRSEKAPPRLEEVLPPPPAKEDARPHRILRELIKIDLECRWRSRGATAPRLEHYVRQHSQLGPQPSIDLIAEEYRVRQLWGDRPSHADYLSRFPAQAAQLQD